MPPCIVVGASGAIGRFLLPQLRDAGREVIALSRCDRPSGDPGVRWMVGNVDQQMPDLPTGAALFSLGPLDAFARWYARTPQVVTPRVIAFGSMSIVSKANSSDAAERELVQRLTAAERELAQAATARGAALTIFRPTLIYGAGVDRSLTPIAQFALRWRFVPRLLGASGLRQPVHAEDLAKACVAALDNPRTWARTYALGGAERLSFETMLERLRQSLPVRTFALPVPLRATRHVARAAYRVGLPAASAAALERLTQDLIADHAAAIADFGWAPRGFHPQPEDWQAT